MIVVKDFLEIFKCRVELIIGSRQEQSEYMKQSWNVKESDFNPNFGGETREIADKNGAIAGIMVWMPEYNLGRTDHDNTLTHECVHVAFKVAARCNLPYSEDNSEVVAYLAGYYKQRFMLGIKKHYKKILANAEKSNA